MEFGGNKTLQRSKGIKKRQKIKEEKQQEKEDTERQWQMFKEIWVERGPYSEIDGQYLGPEPLSTMFHHIYPKSKYKALKYVKPNIILISWEQHSTVEQDMYKYPEINKRREKLKEKYNL